MINYKRNKLSVENKYVLKIAKNNQTPFYLYSAKAIKDNFEQFCKVFKKINPLICFSVKSNSNPKILRMLKGLGAGADVVSGGELLKVLNAGISPKKIVFSGVGKSTDELKMAIKRKILLINAESYSEIALINKLSKSSKRKTSIGLRLNPDIDAKTLGKISTGRAEDKFGLSRKKLLEVCKNLKEFKHIELNSLSVHIGSQILTDVPFKKTLKVIEEIIRKTKTHFKFIDLGGGFGISYSSKEKRIKLDKYSNLVDKFKKKYNCNIIFEPGRAIIGNTGILVSKIQYIKNSNSKSFVIIDAGMNDFMRPALYGAYHSIVPLIKSKGRSMKNLEFVGPICETSCKFSSYKKYYKIKEEDYVAILDVGAYGSVLSSNYNTKPLPAEILIDNNHVKIIRKRQTLSEIIKN
tara:strand:+ start:461 stop:1684 length:1224 start_codon:yes stop_codon:yes gene_type:complete